MKILLMRILLIPLALILFHSNLAAQEPMLVIENGRVIIGNGSVLERASVVVSGERIVAVSPTPPQAPEARRIDASGKTVLPGLIDGHVHLTVSPDVAGDAVLEQLVADTLPDHLRSFLRHGVTTVRSTGEHWPWIREVRERVARGELDGPRILTSGPIVTYEGGHPATVLCAESDVCRSTLAVEVSTAHEAREAVRGLATEGVDLVKLAQDTVLAPGVQMPDDVFAAIVEQAHRERMAVVAHVESDIADVPAMERAIELGVDGLAHWPLEPIPPEISRRIGRMLVRQGTHVTSTLTSIFVYWDVPVDAPFDATTSIGGHLLSLARSLAAAADAGALVAAGTDWCVCSPRARSVPALGAGALLHTEMIWLAMGGMTNAEVLAAATSDAARALGLGPVLGSLEPGKIADILVVEGDPLADLAALRSIRHVVKAGRVVAH